MGGGGGGSIGLIHFLVCCNLYATLKINKNTELHIKYDLKVKIMT